MTDTTTDRYDVPPLTSNGSGVSSLLLVCCVRKGTMGNSMVRLRVSLYPVNGQMVQSEMGIHPDELDRVRTPLPRYPSFTPTYEEIAAFETARKLRNSRIAEREGLARHISKHVEHTVLRWMSQNDPKE